MICCIVSISAAQKTARCKVSKTQNDGQDYAYDQEPLEEESISGRSLSLPEEDLYDQDYANEPYEEQMISGRSLLFGDQEADYSEFYENDHKLYI